MVHREPAAESVAVSPEEMERTIDRFAGKYRPYTSKDSEGFLYDFDALERSGLVVVSRRKTGDLRSMIEVTVRGSSEAMEVVEARWRDTLRLSGESAHRIEGDRFRFVSRGRVGGAYVTGEIKVLER